LAPLAVPQPMLEQKKLLLPQQEPNLPLMMLKKLLILQLRMLKPQTTLLPQWIIQVLVPMVMQQVLLIQ
jgi:hypothetical protein